ncbi:MAG: peptidylprolyl isomerase, partial [Acidobacteriota bacterium]
LPASAPALASLEARIDVKGRYYRVGEPVEVRVTLENAGDEPVANAEGIPLYPSLEIEAGDQTLRAANVPEFDASTQPRVFRPGSSYQQILDLTSHFAILGEPGTYQIRFRAGEVVSEPTTLVLAPPYDPDQDYQATLKTDFGDITFDLLEDAAPEHVKNFVDLARQGFYDDTMFSFIARGDIIVGGVPGQDGTGATGYVLAPEIGNLTHERGTLAAVRTAGPDSGSQFFIDLRRAPERDGKFSIFGRMVAGGEALDALGNVPTSGQNYEPRFKPLKDTLLRGVEIAVRPPADEDPAPPDEAGRR